MAECNTATMSPKRPRKRATVCGVSAISGTSTMADLPSSNARRMARRYTSVLPDPVTPSTRITRPSPWSMASPICRKGVFLASCRSKDAHMDDEARSAALPSAAAWSLSCGSSFAMAGCVLMRRRRSTRTTPFFSRADTADPTLPYSMFSSETLMSPWRTASTTAICLLAFARGLKESISGPATTHLSSTLSTCGLCSIQPPLGLRTIRGTPPGGVSRRTHTERGAT